MHQGRDLSGISIILLLTWTVHRLEPKLLLLNVKVKHVVPIMVCMTRGLPEIKIVDVWCHNLLIFILPVLSSDVLHKTYRVSKKVSLAVLPGGIKSTSDAASQPKWP